MRFSFISSVIDGPTHLNLMLQSLATQEYTNFELVIVVDKPKDPNIEALLMNCIHEFKHHFPILVRQNKKQMGLTKNLNAASRIARGDVLVRIDADDFCTPDRLKVILPYFQNGFELVGNASQLINPLGQKTSRYPSKCLTHAEALQDLSTLRRVVAHSGLAFSKTLFKRLNGYDEYFTYAQDYDFLLRALDATSTTEFVIIDNVLTGVRLHEAAISQSKHRLAQITFQLEAIINRRMRKSVVEQEQSDVQKQALTNQIMASPHWEIIKRVQEFKARMRSKPRHEQLMFVATHPRLFIDLLNQRRLLLKIVEQLSPL